MRNLKKFLALVMAMVMAFSLMVTVNAAHIGTQYTDEDDVTPAFEEAMEVLTGMGVYQGDPGATFRPASTITRAETAALIYRLATGDTTDARKDLYKDYGNFADVTSTDWFAGYVGYCANAGYIKGHGGYFNPYGQVTGYEVLAMVLRAVGYDKNHEFEGATWQTNVSALSTQLGILKQVKSTDYGDRLYEASRRDVVASLLFETAANVNMVSYSAMAGYNKYVNLINNELNPTLGEKNFGLTDTTRIILGNQATGEKYTQMGAEEAGIALSSDKTEVPYSVYAYPGETVTVGGKSITAPAGLKVDFKTGLDLFGHKTKVWYDDRPGSTNSDGAQPTFAWFDKAELSAVVKVDEDAVLNAAATDNTTTSFAEAAKAAGFTKLADTDKVYFSGSFSRIGGGDDATARATDIIKGNANSNTAMNGTAGGSSETGQVSNITSTVWVLISNDNDKKVDVAIPVVLDLANVKTVNNAASTKTFSLGDDAGNTIATDTSKGHAADLVAKTEQKLVMDPEQIVLGNTVIAVEITKNTADNGDPVYWLDTPTKTITKTVVAFDKVTGTVTFDDGTTLDRTIIADEHLVSGKNNVKTYMGNAMDYGQYEFTLDMQGKWIHAKRIYDQGFLYATYLDYATELGTSAFTHRMVGVDFNGEVKTYDIDRYNRTDDDSANTQKLDGTATAGQPAALGIPYRAGYKETDGQTMIKRDAAGTTVDYRGFVISGTTAKSYVKVLNDVFGVQSFADDTGITGNFQAETDGSDTTTTGVEDNGIIIDKDTLKLGVKRVPEMTSTVNLYLTEQTKFIVVNKDGYGTDSLKPTVYNGLEEFLGASKSVSMTFTANNVGEFLYTSSPYIYANTGASARQVDTIFIPGAELTRTGVNNLYFFPAKTDVMDGNGTGAKLFTAYQNGEKTTVWVREDAATGGADDATTIEGNIVANTKYGSFQYLEPTDDKAADGRPIYKIAPAMGVTYDGKTFNTEVCYTGVTYAGLEFLGTTNNGLTALVNDGANIVVGTKDAKVINLVDGYTIENINDLNDVASVSGTLVNKVIVDIEFAEAGSNQVANIYVVAVTKLP